jgi:hypothetical protein
LRGEKLIATAGTSILWSGPKPALSVDSERTEKHFYSQKGNSSRMEKLALTHPLRLTLWFSCTFPE